MKRRFGSVAVCTAAAVIMAVSGMTYNGYADETESVEVQTEEASESEILSAPESDTVLTPESEPEAALESEQEKSTDESDPEQLLAPELEDMENQAPELQMTGSAYSNLRSNATYGSIVDSYLEYDGSNIMKVQSDGSGCEVTYYDTSLNQKSKRTIPAELPIFGGFYATESNYYIVSGQSNDAQSASVECYRITKYDKNWNRLGSVGLYDCNTTLPFRAGSCRMTHSGKYLYVHTCHQMYTSERDGLRHQANLRIQVDTSSMTITDSYSAVMNISWGYCSHSFDQYALIDNDHIVTLDHGDAYPRAAAVCVYKSNFSSGKFMTGWSPVTYYKALTIPGNIGANSTGVSLGGFEASTSSYLVAASSVSLNESSYSSSGIRNIVVSTVSKTDGSVKEHWITNYTDASAIRPHLVSLGSNEYMLLWMKGSEKKVYYCMLDGNGDRITDIKTKDAVLTSCKPIVVNGKLIWYQNDNNNVIFHQIGIPGYKDPKIGAFVVRLYETCLGRTPDAGGLQHWHDLLWEGTSTGAGVAKGFVFSKEYLAKNTSNAEYVDMLYRVFMDREADAGGKAHWLELLDQGVSREYVFRGFAQSAEYTNICNSYGIIRGEVSLTQARDQNPRLTAYVNRMYTKALGRAGEEDGLNHWCRTIQTKTRTPEQVAESFINSKEFKLKNLNDEEYIKVLYRTFMGREYDAAGLAHWKQELARGCSREEILHRFATSKEFRAIQASFGI